MYSLGGTEIRHECIGNQAYNVMQDNEMMCHVSQCGAMCCSSIMYYEHLN